MVKVNNKNYLRGLINKRDQLKQEKEESDEISKKIINVQLKAIRAKIIEIKEKTDDSKLSRKHSK